jgi:hypothetical protein
MNIKHVLASVLLPIVASISGVVATPFPVLAQIDRRAHEAIVEMTRLGVCLHARRGVKPEVAANMVYNLATVRFGFSRQQVDAYLDQPNFMREVEGGIEKAGGCERFLESSS